MPASSSNTVRAVAPPASSPVAPTLAAGLIVITLSLLPGLQPATTDLYLAGADRALCRTDASRPAHAQCADRLDLLIHA